MFRYFCKYWWGILLQVLMRLKIKRHIDQPSSQANETPWLQILPFCGTVVGTFVGPGGTPVGWSSLSLSVHLVVVCEKCFVITVSLVSQSAAINVSAEMRISNTKRTAVKYNTKQIQNTISEIPYHFKIGQNTRIETKQFRMQCSVLTKGRLSYAKSLTRTASCWVFKLM